MKIVKIVITSIIICGLFSSCATVANGRNQSIGISSDPSFADVYVDNNFVGKTPLEVEMTRKDRHVVRIELEGFQSYEAVFSKKVSGWVFGNVAFGGFLGLAIDAISGGMYRLTPDQIRAELMRNNMVYYKNTKGSYIAIVLQPDPSWEKIGNLVCNN